MGKYLCKQIFQKNIHDVTGIGIPEQYKALQALLF
jgi:hypothetical protein